MVIRPHPFNGRRGGTIRGRSGRPPVGPMLAGRYGKWAGNSRVERPAFHAPLRTSIAQILGSGAPTFTRATTATVKDHDGIIRTALSGEARFQGARRVYNILAGNTDTSTGGSFGTSTNGTGAVTATANSGIAPDGKQTAMLLEMSLNGGNTIDDRAWYSPGSHATGRDRIVSVWVKAADEESTTKTVQYRMGTSSVFFTPTSEWQRLALVRPGAGDNADATHVIGLRGTFTSDSVKLYVWGWQFEFVEGQSVMAPSEYVSVGVKSAPYHGASVDGVRYFDRHNGNVVRQNMLLRSQELDNASWGKTNTSATANQAMAPDGSFTAELVTETGAGALISQNVVSVAGQVYTISRHVKRGNHDWIRISAQVDGANRFEAYFNLATGKPGSSLSIGAGVFLASRMEDVGGGWYRCSVTGYLTSGTVLPNMCCSAAADNDVTRVSGAYRYEWGAQTQPGHHASTYVPTTSAAVNTGIVESYQGPAIDEDELLGYLAEGARTNLCLQSEDFSTTWTNANSTESTNQAVAPDGTLTADQLIESNDSGVQTTPHLITQTFTKAGSALNYAFSMWVKPNGRTWVALQLQDGTQACTAYYNLSGSGTVGSHVGGSNWTAIDATVTAFANGWYRLTQVVTSSTSTTLLARLILAEGDGDTTYAGDGASGVYIWGAQLEQASFASSYIPTTTAGVTRNADALTYDFSGNADDEAGTCFAELFTSWGSATGTTNMAVGFTNANAGPLFNPNNAPTTIRTGDGSTQLTFTGLDMSTGVRKRASSWGASGQSVVGDGGTVVTGAFDGSLGSSGLGVGNRPDGASSWYGTVKNVRIWERQLSDAQLQAMTA